MYGASDSRENVISTTYIVQSPLLLFCISLTKNIYLFRDKKNTGVADRWYRGARERGNDIFQNAFLLKQFLMLSFARARIETARYHVRVYVSHGRGAGLSTAFRVATDLTATPRRYTPHGCIPVSCFDP